MALENKGFRTPPPMEPRGKGPYVPSSRPEKGGLRGETSRIFRKEAGHFLGAVKKVLRGPKIFQKSVREERIAKKNLGILDTFLGVGVKKEKKSIPSKIKSSLFGKREKVIKYKEFETFLKDPSLYKVDKLSPYQRKKKWGEIFKKTGTGYLERWKVEKYFKDRALSSPKTMEDLRKKSITKIYRNKFLKK